jgi:hypothetical protein
MGKECNQLQVQRMDAVNAIQIKVNPRTHRATDRLPKSEAPKRKTVNIPNFHQACSSS